MNTELLKMFMWLLPVTSIVYYTCFEEDNVGIYSKRELSGVADELLHGLCRLTVSLNAAFFMTAIPGAMLVLLFHAVKHAIWKAP